MATSNVLVFAVRALANGIEAERGEREARARTFRDAEGDVRDDLSADDHFELGHAEGMACAYRGLERRLDELTKAIEDDARRDG